MKVVILAAGKGTRLGAQPGPKPLTLLANGKSILQMQLETLQRFIPVDDIRIVVGYQKEMIMDLFPELLFVVNPDYAKENTSKSLYKAIKKIDDDLLWLNGDVVFHPSALEKLLEINSSAMLVNRSKVGEEEVKYRTDSHGIILEVSKEVRQPEGEALGINLFKRKDLNLLKKHLETCKPQDYFEKAVEGCLNEGIKILAVPISQDLCVEIDFNQDIVRANSLIKHWQISN